jgi:hypothetical protein
MKSKEDWLTEHACIFIVSCVTWKEREREEVSTIAISIKEIGLQTSKRSMLPPSKDSIFLLQLKLRFSLNTIMEQFFCS